MRLTRARVEWKVEDMWIGLFWKHGYITTDDGLKRTWTDIWICILPCLPLHLTVVHSVMIPFTKPEESSQ